MCRLNESEKYCSACVFVELTSCVSDCRYSGDSNASSEVVNEDDSFYVNMTTEDLLQPGHVVKERWKVVSLPLVPFEFFSLCVLRYRYFEW
ncbi:hypothetical protein NPIL_376631 [Nephila pilipes]|uniref:Uncharacterized protein n=1 Tax=Nephila pilipes TaxID=299642 RepID=A0A8X6MQZ7_NEPPI|nr:hypothetical protein NPIL_222161 [Nephila pilipes]GFT35454.1 hypothetical protein NPIL_376631 [Nephila pilipes]